MAQNPRRPRQIGRPLADLVAPCIGKTLAARGFAAADIVMAWPDIVGARLAAVSEPVGIEWPRGARSQAGHAIGEARPGGVLVVRVEGAFGLEAQHLAPAILERVNAYFGWRCAERLVVRQGRVTRKPAGRPVPPPPDPLAVDRALGIVGDIGDDGLRKALARLGAQVLAGRPPAT